MEQPEAGSSVSAGNERMAVGLTMYQTGVAAQH
jgi:hypothetical protein